MSETEPRKRKNKKQFRIMIGVLVFVVLYLFLTPFLFTLHSPNSGEHTGYITAVEQSGLIWSTHTVYVKTDPQSSQEDAYCVTDPEVIKALKEKSITRELVILKYAAPFFVPGSKCKNESSIVYSVSEALPGN
jgi:hypothetical protein